MSAHSLAAGILYLHVGVVAFNLFWMGAVPLGAWLGWRWVHNFWWRSLHLGSLLVVALQAALGRLCFLTIWQNALEIQSGARLGERSLLERLAIDAIYWPLPADAFVVLYVLALAYTAALWFLVPPKRKGNAAARLSRRPFARS
jgi:Protein of Unknown function (DUF2784)